MKKRINVKALQNFKKKRENTFLAKRVVNTFYNNKINKCCSDRISKVTQAQHANHQVKIHETAHAARI